MKNAAEMSFEEALQSLENTVSALRGADCTLEESMKGFEAGMQYYDRCADLLSEAKGKVEIYSKETDRLEEF